MTAKTTDIDLKLPLAEPYHAVGRKWIAYAQDDNDTNDIAHAVWASIDESVKAADKNHREQMTALRQATLDALRDALSLTTASKETPAFVHREDDGQLVAIVLQDDEHRISRTLWQLPTGHL